MHPQHYFGTVKRIKTWAVVGLNILWQMAPVVFFWIPRLATLSSSFSYAPLPTAVRLLAGAGRGLALKMSQKK